MTSELIVHHNNIKYRRVCGFSQYGINTVGEVLNLKTLTSVEPELGISGLRISLVGDDNVLSKPLIINLMGATYFSETYITKPVVALKDEDDGNLLLSNIKCG